MFLYSNNKQAVKDRKLQNIAEIIKQINLATFHVHTLEDNIVKMSILPQTIYRLNAFSINIPVVYFADTERKY